MLANIKRDLITIVIGSVVIGFGFWGLQQLAEMPKELKPISYVGIEQDLEEVFPMVNTGTAPQSRIKLNTGNTLVLRGIVTDESVSKVIKEAYTLSIKSNKSKTLYLVLDTPGGEIPAGAKLIDSLKALPQKIETITMFSASMGFMIAQHLGTRYVLPSGVFMAHKAYIGNISGELFGKLENIVNFHRIMVTRLEIPIATRLGKTLEEYRYLIRNEYWTQGVVAVSQNVADKVALVHCSPGLIKGVEKFEIKTFFAVAKVVFSKCPLITHPLKVDFKLDMSAYMTPISKKRALIKIKKYVNKLLYKKRDFIHDYILPKGLPVE